MERYGNFMSFAISFNVKRVITVALSSMLVVSMLTGCSKAANEGEPSTDTSSQGNNEVSSPLPSSEPEPLLSPLTGVSISDRSALTRRPIAIMINNIKPALPQKGIAEASVIYEMPVEGGVTRLMAVYDDISAVPTVGSIRSARHDFVELAFGLDAIFVHFGWSDSAKATISELSVNNINGTQNTSYFYKDEVRAQTRASEHCWYTTSELVQDGVAKLEYETTLKSEMDPIYSFSTDGKDVMEGDPSALEATDVLATFASGVTAGFTYDDATARYAKSQYGAPHIDESIGGGFSTDNVFLVYTNAGMMSDNYHREIRLEEGKGYYLSKGKAVPVTFKKAAKDDILRVYSQNGSEQLVNPGNSYVCFLPKENEEKLVGIGATTSSAVS